MRKILILLISLIFLSCNSQEHVDLKRTEGGLFVVECELNKKLSIPFMIDLGASDTCIPYHIFVTLIQTGTVVQEDMLPIRKYSLADGSTVDNRRFILREIRIGTKIFKNIPVIVVDNINAPLLLGQSTLERFRFIMFDYENNLMIYE